MKQKKVISLFVILCVVLLFVLNLLWKSESTIVSLGFCDIAGSTCTYYFTIGVIKPFMLCLFSILATLLILFFVREEVFKSWLRFAYWAVPIGVIILWISPTTTPGGFGPDMFDFTKQTASWLVSGAFLIISLIIILRKSFKRG